MDGISHPPGRQQHRQVWDLIPWVLNGTTSEAERELVLAHLQSCADCRAEFEFQQDLQRGLSLSETAPGLDADRALQAFWAAEAAPAAPLATPRLGGQRRQRWLVAAVLVQAVGLAGFAALLGLRTQGDPAVQGDTNPLVGRQTAAWGRAVSPEYQVLSRPGAAATAAVIRIVPAPGLQIGELRALLARSDLQLVQTSADAGHLGLALASGARFDRAQALQRLRAEPGILLAEPILTDGH